jgi:DNA replication protein DnaC
MNKKLYELLAPEGDRGRQLQRAKKEAIPISEVICRLLQEEQVYRQNQSLLYQIKGARIPWDWTLKTFPFHKLPGVSKTQISELSGLAFVERKENIFFIGNHGTGKSGLAIGFLHQALLSGYKGRFYHAQDLILCRYNLLVIDELGYLTIKP